MRLAMLITVFLVSFAAFLGAVYLTVWLTAMGF